MAEENGDLTAESEETLAEEASTPSRPDWLPSQYENEQAFVNAHQAAQRKITEQGQQMAELREQMDELASLAQQAPEQQYQDPNQNPLVMEYQRAVEDGDIARQLQVQAQLMDAVVQQRLEAQNQQNDTPAFDDYQIRMMRQDVVSRYGADEQMQAKVSEIMDTNPVISRRLQEIAADPRAHTIGDLEVVLDTAYQLAGAAHVAAENASLAQQQAEQDLARQRKLDQESLTGTGPTRVAPQNEQDAAWERIKGQDVGGIRLGNVT